MTYPVDHKNQFSNNHQSKIEAKLKKSQLTRGGLIGLALLPLSACGSGGGTSSPTTTPPPPPPPTPDFTENPTNTFIARDDNDRTLAQGSATADLAVTGKGGNDTITTGSGGDSIDGAAGNDMITSNGGDDIIKGGAGNDIIDGGAGADRLYGGEGDDRLLYDQSDAVIDGGNGIDTLVIQNDTSYINFYLIDNIEVIDASQGVLELSNITVSDLLQATDENNQLIFAGGANDEVNSIDQGWIQGDDQVIDGETYYSYTVGEATLLIDSDITQDIT